MWSQFWCNIVKPRDWFASQNAPEMDGLRQQCLVICKLNDRTSIWLRHSSYVTLMSMLLFCVDYSNYVFDKLNVKSATMSSNMSASNPAGRASYIHVHSPLGFVSRHDVSPTLMLLVS